MKQSFTFTIFFDTPLRPGTASWRYGLWSHRSDPCPSCHGAFQSNGEVLAVTWRRWACATKKFKARKCCFSHRMNLSYQKEQQKGLQRDDFLKKMLKRSPFTTSRFIQIYMMESAHILPPLSYLSKSNN